MREEFRGRAETALVSARPQTSKAAVNRKKNILHQSRKSRRREENMSRKLHKLTINNEE
jgi:hypothetical protein